jgi:gliding motility-associated-like protein
MYSFIKIGLFIILLNLLGSQSTAQGLCSNTNYTRGGFELSAENICISQSISLRDQSNGKNIKYIFDYQSESFEEASEISVSNSSHTYRDSGKSKVYTILQIGEINGKTSIACRNVNVMTNNVPEYSYTPCGSSVEFNIPKHALNNFDSYLLELQGQQILIDKSELPYKIRKSVSLPASYRISGSYTDASKNCQVFPGSFKAIPSTSIVTSLPFHPNIDKLTLLNLSTVKLEYSGPYYGDPTLSPTLFRYEKNMPLVSAVAIKENLIPGDYELTIPDTSKSYCYFVKKNNFCGQGQVEESAEICTHPIFSAKFNPNENQNELVWSKYPTLFKGVYVPPFDFSVLFTGLSYNTNQKIKVVQGNSSTSVISMNKDASAFNHKPVDCKKKYCYSTEQTISGTLNYIQYRGVSVSNKVCIDQSKVLVPASSNFFVTTKKNKNQVHFEDDGVWPLKKEKWFLYKLKEGNYYKIDSVQNASMIFTDSTEVSKTESYKIGFLDQCNSYSKLSDSASSIYLDVSLPDELKWTSASPFSSQKVLNYEIFHMDDSSGMLSKLDEVSNNNYKLDLSPYLGQTNFVIKAVSSDIDQPASTSNIQSLDIPSTIYIPTAFSPNGDGTNDVLKFTGKFKTKDKFVLKIYNRFGQQIKQINNFSETWDGRFDGKDLESGQYLYSYSVIPENGPRMHKSGEITILR